MNKASRAYLIEFGLAMGLYMIVLFIAIILLKNNPGVWWRAPIAITPVIPILFGLWAFVRFLNRMDELQQRIQFNAIGFGFAATAVVTFTYGFLQNAGFPPLNWSWIFPIMLGFWGLGGVIASWRYR